MDSHRNTGVHDMDDRYDGTPAQKVQYLAPKIQLLLDNINGVLVGQEHATRLSVVAFLAGGHALIEDVPGVGKTLLAKTLAQSVHAKFKRIQCTPDLLPSDISGVSVFEAKEGVFKFMPGPIFTNILLADEINRATPRTQSSLLEAMEENQVTTDGATRRLPDLFFVIATENPIEYHGTFPLPEAQLDRFMISLSLGYPKPSQEVEILDKTLDEGFYSTGYDEWLVICQFSFFAADTANLRRSFGSYRDRDRSDWRDFWLFSYFYSSVYGYGDTSHREEE